jgi:hypothetical protein
MATTATARRRNVGGRPTLFDGKKPRKINLSDFAIAKADSDAKALSKQRGIIVSRSAAVETAVRAFRPKP